MQRFITKIKESNRVKKAAKARRELTEPEKQFVEECRTRRFDVLDALYQHPEFVTLVVPELIDCSGRKFTDIPLFTYMLWTGDAYGMQLFLVESESFDIYDLHEIYSNLDKQLKTFRDLKVSFSIGDTRYNNHAQYSDQAHIDALKEYVKLCEAGCSDEQRQTFWVKTVGTRQRMVELHIAISLCSGGSPSQYSLSMFAPKEEKNDKPIWFPLSESGLGKEYAICSANNLATACVAPEPDLVKQMITKLEEIEATRSFHIDCIEKKLKELKRKNEDEVTVATLRKM